ncbi:MULTISPECIES: photosynthetic complex assembly protein PuhC [unclassified Hwanghaeella]|jgi:putative photosynthetic complex assembly protein|uniref:photosynthetic complex assembly protein PuhC n=1 Tax=unclassified Hwanghaeella TaxID=2605944 RepID=UPI000C89A02B|nr:photosynthetic complex assembly protein PuhC [Rhodospirillales bacterium]|tara:strand:+ start:764 stop:1246 length:483 start_codon:yes stop_codon:yes gene_type:complete
MKPVHHHHDTAVPRPLLIAVAVMVALTLILSAWSSYQKHQTTAQRDADIQEIIQAGETRIRAIGFADQPNGAIAVLDGETSAIITAVEPKEDGFVRGVLRGFARERRSMGIGPTPPFHLILTADGALILSDPQTNREVFLNAFGPTNAQAFSRLFFAHAS